MKLNVIIDEYTMDIEVPDTDADQRNEAYDRLDLKMDAGIQLGREWLAGPNRLQRCQLAADRLLEAIDGDNYELAMLSTGYILSRMPGVTGVRIDNNGEPQETTFYP